MITINLGKSFLRIPKPFINTEYSYLTREPGFTISDIVRDYHRLGYFHMDKCKSIISKIFGIITEAIARKECVDIDGFGNFRVYRYMGLSPTYNVMFRPYMRLRAHFNRDHKEYLQKAIAKKRYRKKNLFDFSPLAESFKAQKPQFVRDKKSRKTTVKAMDIDIKKIVERLQDINERKYSADWRRKYRSEDR